MKSSYK